MAKPYVLHATVLLRLRYQITYRAHTHTSHPRNTHRHTHTSRDLLRWICEHAVRVSCKCLVFHFNSTFEIYYLNQTHTDIIVFYRKKV